MHAAGKIRIFKLGAQDEAIMFMPDYLGLVETVYNDLLESDPESAQLVKTFQTEVAVKVKDQAISRDLAVKTFNIPHHDKLRPLIQHGLLALNGATSYKITIPNFGLFWKWVIRGRQEVESIISKQRHKEISQLVRDPQSQLLPGTTTPIALRSRCCRNWSLRSSHIVLLEWCFTWRIW